MSGIFQLFSSAWKGFYEDACSLRASALTYYTVLSIVPVLAVAFGIAKGFGYDGALEENFRYLLKDHQAIADKIVEFVNTLLEQTKGQIIAGVGLVVLLISAGMLLRNIEGALNNIWQVKKFRSFSRMFADYLAIIICCPIFFVLSSSLMFFLLSELARAIRSIGLSDYGNPVVYMLFYGSPLFFSWVLFSFVYAFIPNTKVRIQYAVLGGVLAGTLYQIGLMGFLIFQYKLSNYGAIYGSFAALPLFLVWVQLSWMILLFGGEFAYHASIRHEEHRENLTNGLRVTPSQVALLTAFLCLKRSKDKAPPLSADDISKELGLEKVIVNELLDSLLHSNLLEPASQNGSRVVQYVPTPKMVETRISALPKMLSPLFSRDIVIKNTEETQRAIALFKSVE